MSAIEMQTHLRELQAERMLAGLEGLGPDSPYMTGLDDEIAATEAAYVCAAVTEIASLRAELSGPQAG
jgi:hypothetical protein